MALRWSAQPFSGRKAINIELLRSSPVSALRSTLGENNFKEQSFSNFPECYWSSPKVALAEVQKADLDVVSYAGVESFANGMGALLERLAEEHPESYANVVQVAAETCELPQYRESTDHLHIVVRKRTGC